MDPLTRHAATAKISAIRMFGILIGLNRSAATIPTQPRQTQPSNRPREKRKSGNRQPPRSAPQPLRSRCLMTRWRHTWKWKLRSARSSVEVSAEVFLPTQIPNQESSAIYNTAEQANNHTYSLLHRSARRKDIRRDVAEVRSPCSCGGVPTGDSTTLTGMIDEIGREGVGIGSFMENTCKTL